LVETCEPGILPHSVERIADGIDRNIEQDGTATNAVTLVWCHNANRFKLGGADRPAVRQPSFTLVERTQQGKIKFRFAAFVVVPMGQNLIEDIPSRGDTIFKDSLEDLPK